VFFSSLFFSLLLNNDDASKKIVEECFPPLVVVVPHRAIREEEEEEAVNFPAAVALLPLIANKDDRNVNAEDMFRFFFLCLLDLYYAVVLYSVKLTSSPRRETQRNIFSRQSDDVGFFKNGEHPKP